MSTTYPENPLQMAENQKSADYDSEDKAQIGGAEAAEDD